MWRRLCPPNGTHLMRLNESTIEFLKLVKQTNFNFQSFQISSIFLQEISRMSICFISKYWNENRCAFFSFSGEPIRSLFFKTGLLSCKDRCMVILFDLVIPKRIPSEEQKKRFENCFLYIQCTNNRKINSEKRAKFQQVQIYLIEGTHFNIIPLALVKFS